MRLERFKYSMVQLDSKPEEWGPRDWERNVPRVDASREVNRLVEEMTREAANCITRKAQQNDLRVGHYNMMSRNDFDNKDFEELCQFIVDRVELAIFLGELRENGGRALERLIDSCVTMSMAAMTQTFDEPNAFMEDMRGTRDYDDNMINFGLFESTLEAIKAMYDNAHPDDVADILNPRGNRGGRGRDNRDSRDQRRDSRDHRRDSRDGYRSSSSGSSSRSGGRKYGYDKDAEQNRGYSGAGFARTSERNHRPKASGVRSFQEQSIHGREGRHGVHEVSSNAFAKNANDWDGPLYIADNDKVQEQPVEEVRQPENDNRYAEPSVRRGGRTTRPVEREAEEIIEDHLFDLQPPAPPKEANPPAPPPPPQNFTVEDGFLVTRAGRKIKLLVKKGVKEVDIIGHSRPYFAGGPATPNNGENIARTLSLAQAVGKDKLTPEQIADSVIVESAPSLHNSIASLVSDVTTTATLKSMKDAGENTNGQRKILHRAAVVHTSVAGHKQLDDFHKEIRSQDTLADVLKKLRSSVEAAIATGSPEDAFVSDIKAAADLYDRLITRDVNLYCTQVLGIGKGDTVITSALEDLMSLFQYLHQRQMVLEADALRGFLHRMTANMLDGWSSVNRAIADSIRVDALGDQAEDESIGLAFIAQSFNVTHVPYTLKELGYDMSKLDAIQSTTLVPLLVAALKIDHTELVTDPMMSEPGRILITRDRQAFRVFNYPTAPDSIIISRIELN